MAPQGYPSWRPLPVSHAAVPDLLVSASFSTAPVSYCVHVTDLANVWLERLERKAILLRSLEEETTIDPSDDPENFKELIHCIGSAFDPQSPRHPDTSLTLRPASPSSQAAPDDLVLEVTCLLPSGLEPLKWPIRLRHGGPAAVATELVLPLVQAQMTRMQEVEALVAVIKEKDGVIIKVLDKLDSLGAKLDQIFPTLAAPGNKAITRAAAEARIKGLARFDRGRLLQPLEDVGTDEEQGEKTRSARPGNTSELINAVFGDENGLRHRPCLEYSKSPALNHWWRDIGIGVGSSEAAIPVGRNMASSSVWGSASLSVGSLKSKVKHGKTLETPSNRDDDDDDFEVQATPPHLILAREANNGRRKSPPKPHDDDDDDESTASEDEGEGEEKETQIPDSNPPCTTTEPPKATPAVKPRRLGALGRRRVEPEPKAALDIDADTASGSETGSDDEKVADSGNKNGTDGNTDAVVDAPLEPDPPPPTSPPRRKPRPGGLGRIGGNRTANRTSEGRESKDVDTAGPSADVSSLSSEHGAGDERGRAAEVVDASRRPARRETSEERADRRREELQRQLAEKAAKGPAKKRRKF